MFKPLTLAVLTACLFAIGCTAASAHPKDAKETDGYTCSDWGGGYWKCVKGSTIFICNDDKCVRKAPKFLRPEMARPDLPMLSAP